MDTGIRLHSDMLYLSYGFLKSKGVSDKTISTWSCRQACKKRYFDSRPYIEYKTIPKPTLKNLPSELDLRAQLLIEDDQKKQNSINELLHNAFEKDFIRFRDEYKSNNQLTPDKIMYCAKLRAVWEVVLSLKVGRGDTQHLFMSMNQLFPDRYKSYGTFCTTKTKAKKDINSVVIDTRWFREQQSPIKPEILHCAKTLISNPIAKTGRSIHRSLQTFCEEHGYETPSYSWVKKFVKEQERNVEIYSHRYGKERYFNNLEPYAKIIPALHAGSQWQIDGWDLPFYYHGYNKLILIAVFDAHSKKVVGYSIGESENTQTILEAIQDAVTSTGFLPFEIVSDNHSFNKTKEAEFFKLAIDSIGTTWTVSHNPRHKAIAERHFRNFGERHCKEFDGYIGQGIKTKEESGRPSQEYIDEFQKVNTVRSKEEIILIGDNVVFEFNQTPLRKLDGRTPNEAHEQSEKPNVFKIDLFDRLRLFTKHTELTVRRGQINITRSGVTHEFQLSAEQYVKLNDKKVTVRYEDFEIIYLFDSKDRPIGSVKNKITIAIHGALSDQTPEDIEKLNRNKGRLNGIKAQARKENERLRDEVQKISPHAFESMNKINTGKDVLKEAQRNYELKRRAEERGMNLELVETGNRPENLHLKSLQLKERSKSKNIYSPKDHEPKRLK